MRISIRVVALLLTLLLSENSLSGSIPQDSSNPPKGPPSAEPGQGESTDPKDEIEPAPKTAFQRALEAYLVALDRAFVAHATHGLLGVSAHIYPDAWQYEVLSFTADRLERGDSVATVKAKLRRDAKSLERLEGRAGIRIDLVHPQIESEKRALVENPVHFFDADLRRSFEIRLRNERVAWAAWKNPTRLEQARVRVARHYKTRNRVQVPIVSELKPKGPRAVFRGKKATIWGVFKAGSGKKEPADLSLQLSYDELQGFYDDRHVIDLNEPKNHFRQSLELAAHRPGRWVIPTLPADVEGYLRELGTETEGDRSKD